MFLLLHYFLEAFSFNAFYWMVFRKGFESYITSIDHWIAFILLGIIGGKMLIDGIKAEDDEETGEFKLDLKRIISTCDCNIN